MYKHEGNKAIAFIEKRFIDTILLMLITKMLL
jgi:hypothetical protein